MKFDDLIKMYLEEFNPTASTSRYTVKKTSYSTTGPTSFKGQPSGFKGDNKNGENILIPKNFFPQKRRKK